MKVPFSDAEYRGIIRTHFLDVLAERVPKILEDLYGESFSLYKELKAKHGDLSWQDFNYAPNAQLESVNQLHAALEEWATASRLAQEWCIEAAYFTLQYWASAEKPEMVFQGFGGGYVAPSPPDFPVYRPLFEGRQSYLTSVLSVAETYCEGVEAALEHSTQKEKRRLEEHINWTISYRWLNCSFYKIANGNAALRINVSRRVREILKLIDLPD